MYNYFGRFEFYLSETYGQLDDKAPLHYTNGDSLALKLTKDQSITSGTLTEVLIALFLLFCFFDKCHIFINFL